MQLINLTNGMRFGSGVDSITQEVRGDAIEYQQINIGTGGQIVSATVRMIEIQDHLMEEMNMTVSVGARYGLSTGDAKFDFATKNSVNQYSVYMLLRAFVRNPRKHMIAPRLAEDAGRIYRNSPEEFRQIYGDSYIDEIYSGGDFFGLFVFEARDEKSMNDIKADLDISIGGLFLGGEINGAFQNTINRASRKSSFEIHVFREGGTGVLNPTNITELQDIYKQFNASVVANGVDYKASIKEFKYLPLPPSPIWAEQAVRRDIIEQCGQRIIEGIKLRNNIGFILKYPNQFETPDLISLRATFSQVDGLLPELAKRARECSRDIKQCSLGGLEPIVAQLPTRIVNTDPLDAKWQYTLTHDSRAASFFQTGNLRSPIENYDEYGGGRYKLFYNGDTPIAGIFWHPDVHSGNAHVVYGQIFQEYARRGHCAGPLGYPVSDEETFSDIFNRRDPGDGLDRVSTFVNGKLKLDAQTDRVFDYVSPIDGGPVVGRPGI